MRRDTLKGGTSPASPQRQKISIKNVMNWDKIVWPRNRIEPYLSDQYIYVGLTQPIYRPKSQNLGIHDNMTCESFERISA